VRRILDNEYSSDESQASLSANVITEWEYPYNANDYNLVASNNDKAASLKVEQTNDLRRSDLSISFDGNLFGFNEIFQALNDKMAHARARTHARTHTSDRVLKNTVK